jgi:hypothetical protein
MGIPIQPESKSGGDPANILKPTVTRSIKTWFRLTKEGLLHMIAGLRWGVAARSRVWVATNTERNFLAVYNQAQDHRTFYDGLFLFI